MPCSCKIPIESYPENAEWGPIFWKLLHGLAEHIGKQKDKNMQSDEIRIWIHLLNQTQFSLPCDICRLHYTEWLIKNPIDVLKIKNYSDIRDWIRNYLWRLHNTINEGNNKASFPFENLSIYSNINITETWKSLEPIMKKAITLNGISLLSWRKWLSYVRMLQGIYG